MERAIAETNRRREVQATYNREHNIQPTTIKKAVHETVRSYEAVAESLAEYGDEATAADLLKRLSTNSLRLEDLPLLIDDLEKKMKEYAKAMEFEKAAAVRDEIQALRKFLGISDGKLGVGKRKLPRMAGRRR